MPDTLLTPRQITPSGVAPAAVACVASPDALAFTNDSLRLAVMVENVGAADRVISIPVPGSVEGSLTYAPLDITLEPDEIRVLRFDTLQYNNADKQVRILCTSTGNEDDVRVSLLRL